jgi:nucleoside-diphosphate-sugar epimerase
MMKPVLVTGGAGSVGRKVVEKIRAHGDSVRVFDLPNLDYAGLEGDAGTEIVRGNITDSLTEVTADVDAVIHLAALLPPASEKDRASTLSVNVEGTLRLAEALKASNPEAPFVFSSSVSTYGDTTGLKPPIGANSPQHSLDIYAESKIKAEKRLREVCPQATVLRIAGISVPALQEPPEVWPFMADQRIEFVHRDDVVTALCEAVFSEDSRAKVFNIAGGPTWQMTGESYVADYFDLFGVPIEEASFSDTPGWFDWYYTEDSQRTLQYQNTPYGTYLAQLQDLIAGFTED